LIDQLENNFIGRGWSFPPTFSRVNDSVEMVSGEQDIQESLMVLLSTSVGSRIMLPTYGCDLEAQVFKSVTTTFKTLLADQISTAIINWETRINLDDLQISEDNKVDGLLLILLEYTIRKTNSRGNLVYPFYFAEGTLPAAPI
jgi:phage baseplate assembly protein W